MSFELRFKKPHVLQALRYHFIKQTEIKALMMFVNVYAILTAFLLFYKKIRPELFLLGSILWIVLMLVFWYILPVWYYKKSELFQHDWQFKINDESAHLWNEKGELSWEWKEVVKFFESPHFFHFYFGPKSFFIIPKENIPLEEQHLIRGWLKSK